MSLSHEFLQEDDRVVCVPDDERDIVVAGSCPLGQQLHVVLQADLDHNLSCSKVTPRKLQKTIPAVQ